MPSNPNGTSAKKSLKFLVAFKGLLLSIIESVECYLDTEDSRGDAAEDTLAYIEASLTVFQRSGKSALKTLAKLERGEEVTLKFPAPEGEPADE